MVSYRPKLRFIKCWTLNAISRHDTSSWLQSAAKKTRWTIENDAWGDLAFGRFDPAPLCPTSKHWTQGDQRSFRKNSPRMYPNPLLLNLNHGKSGPSRLILLLLKNCTKANNHPKGRNFAQSGHPGQVKKHYLCLLGTKRRTLEISTTSTSLYHFSFTQRNPRSYTRRSVL
jgi:hypothetical protein